jgi:hypothetical protein
MKKTNDTGPLMQRIRAKANLQTKTEAKKMSETGLAARFWAKVDKQQPDGCWLWTAAKDSHGYGKFYSDKRGRPVAAHRTAWVITHGNLLEGQVVRHKCDNPACVNPEHLETGSQAQNLNDMFLRGRNPDRSKGRNGFAKLTLEQVRSIRSAYARGNISHRELATMFHVGATTIHNIIHHQRWAEETNNE